jgi:hypothetical protein
VGVWLIGCGSIILLLGFCQSAALRETALYMERLSDNSVLSSTHKFTHAQSVECLQSTSHVRQTTRARERTGTTGNGSWGGTMAA